MMGKKEQKFLGVPEIILGPYPITVVSTIVQKFSIVPSIIQPGII